jgi:thiol-disulfide isomerase/thioredoxin
MAFVGIGLAGCSGSSGKDSTQTASAVNDLPMLNVTKTNGERLSLRDVPAKSIFIYFNPDCDHCQREATQISQNKQTFKDYTVYFISIDAMENIIKFAKDYNLQGDNFQFAWADFNDVYKYVGPLPEVPAIFIYNNKKLVKRLAGEVKLEELAKYL